MKTFSPKAEEVKHDWYVVDASGKVLGERKSGGDSPITFLVYVMKVFESECLSIAQELQKVPRRVSPCNDQNIVDARIYQRLYWVIDHGLIIDREQVLIRYCRQR